MRAIMTAAAIALAPCAVPAQPGAEPPLPVVLDRVAKYVDGYGAQASAIVAVEKYTQSVVVEGRLPIKPRKLTAAFAIVKVPGRRLDRIPCRQPPCFSSSRGI